MALANAIICGLRIWFRPKGKFCSIDLKATISSSRVQSYDHIANLLTLVPIGSFWGRAFLVAPSIPEEPPHFKPADPDFALNLFEIGIARHKFGLAGLRQRGGKGVRQAELESGLEIGGLDRPAAGRPIEIRLVESPVRPRRCASPFPILAANDILDLGVIDLGHLKGCLRLSAVP